MREIDIVASLEADRRIRDPEPAPAHVRDGHARRRFERPNLSFQDSKALGRGFLASLEQQLHAKTDAERRLSERAQAVLEPSLFKALHRMPGSAHAWEHHALGRAD